MFLLLWRRRRTFGQISRIFPPTQGAKGFGQADQPLLRRRIIGGGETLPCRLLVLKQSRLSAQPQEEMPKAFLYLARQRIGARRLGQGLGAKHPDRSFHQSLIGEVG